VCEKTLTLSADASFALAAAAEEKGLCFYTSYMKRFFSATQKARDLIGGLGHIASVYCRTYQPTLGNAYTGDIPPFHRRDASGSSPMKRLAGGGVLVAGGSHVCDLLLHFVGAPSRVTGRLFERPDESDVDFVAHAMMDLPGGGTVHFEANWHPYDRIGPNRDGWDEAFEVNGAGGRVEFKTPMWNAPERHAPILRKYDAETHAWTEYTFPIENPFYLAEAHFQACIAKGEQGPQDRYTGYRADRLLEAIAASARNQGAWVDLDWRA
jgi:predicted dehydrogenase